MISESDRCDLYMGLGRGGPQQHGAMVVKLAGMVELLGKFHGGESAYVEPTVHYLKFYANYQSRNRNHHKQMDDRKSESILG